MRKHGKPKIRGGNFVRGGRSKWLVGVLILEIIIMAALLVGKELTPVANEVLEYRPEEKVVVARRSPHVHLEPVNPNPFARFFFEPFLAAAFIAGTADAECSAAITTLLFVIFAIAFHVTYGRPTFGSMLRTVLVSLLLSTQAFTVACWLSFFAPTMRYRSTNPNCVIANFHAHTYRSSGLFSPAAVVEWHRRRGFKVVAITDTNSLRGGMEAQRYAAKHCRDITVIVGEELHSRAHLLLLNINRKYSPHENLKRISSEIRSSGGAIIVAHPWSIRDPREEFELPDELLLFTDGFEVINREIICDHIPLWQALYGTLALIASNDFKFGAHGFTATCLCGIDGEESNLLEALRSGKTLPMTWLTHLPMDPLSYELQTWVDKLMTVKDAIMLYPGFVDGWAICSWMLTTLIICIVVRMLPARRERCAYRIITRKAKHHFDWLTIALWILGFCIASFGVAWTWSPTLKMRIDYRPIAVIILWVIGDVLLLWRRKHSVARRLHVIDKL